MLDEMQVYETGLHRRLDLRLMRRSLSSSAGIVMNTAEAAAGLAGEFPELADRTVVLPNGYDAMDFSGRPPERSDEAFRIVHAGYLHTGLARTWHRARRSGDCSAGSSAASTSSRDRTCTCSPPSNDSSQHDPISGRSSRSISSAPDRRRS